MEWPPRRAVGIRPDPGPETLCGHRVPLSNMSNLLCATVGKGLHPKAAISFGNHCHPLGEKHCALGALEQAGS